MQCPETHKIDTRKDELYKVHHIHKALNLVLKEEYCDDFELLVVEIKIANRNIRVISGYGPQESWVESARMPFFLALEEEVVKAQLAGKSILIEFDANCIQPNIRWKG